MSIGQKNAIRRVTPKLLRVTQAVIMLATTFFLGAHVVKWDAVQVDSITLALLGFLLVIPMADLVRKIRFGDFEAEIGRDEVARAQAKAAVEMSPAPEMAFSMSEERVLDLFHEDPRLALAKVRIELEEVLKRLYLTTTESEPDWRRLSLGRLVDGLVRSEGLSGSVASALRDVITLANRAVHGERMELAAAEELALLGVRLVHEVQQINIERILRPVESKIITPEEVDRYRTARYRVTTIVPLVENPTENSYVFDEEGLESFLDGYEEYAEFIVAIGPA